MTDSEKERLKWAQEELDKVKTVLQLLANKPEIPLDSRSSILLTQNWPMKTCLEIAQDRNTTERAIRSKVIRIKGAVDTTRSPYVVHMMPVVERTLDSLYPILKEDEFLVGMSELVKKTGMSTSHLHRKLEEDGIKKHGISSWAKYIFTMASLDAFVQKHKKA